MSQEAMDCLCSLKGVGPATASAVLSAAFPAVYPFMGDELLENTPGLGPRTYTLSKYLELVSAVAKKRQELSKGGRSWTAREVENAIAASVWKAVEPAPPSKKRRKV